MRKLLKHSCVLIPALLLAFLIVVIPQFDNRELILPTQSGKAFGLLWGMLGYMVVILFIAAIKRDILILRVTIIDLLLAIYCLLVVFSYWLYPPDYLQMITFGALVVFYLSVRMLNMKYQILLLLAVIVSGTVQAIYGNLQLWGYYPSNHGIFRMTGSFFNPGPFAGYLAAILPAVLGFYLFNEPVRIQDQPPLVLKLYAIGSRIRTFFYRMPFVSRYFYNNGNGGDTPEKQAERLRRLLDSIVQYFVLGSMIASCLVLPASHSRAAWLAVVVSAGYLLWVKYHPLSHLREWVNTPAKRFLLVSVLIILLISSGSGLYYFKKDSADGRLLIWKVSAQMIKDKPIFGHGADKFTADYMNYQAAYFKPNPDVPEAMQADNVSYAYNEILKLTVEHGIIGLLLALGVIGCLFFGESEKSEEGRRQKGKVISRSAALSFSKCRSFQERRQKESVAVAVSSKMAEGRMQELKNPILFAARGGLLSILIFALFSYPSDILPIKMLFVLFAAVVATHQTPMRLFQLPAKKTALAGKVVWYSVLAIVLITVYPTSQYFTQQYHAYKTWKDACDVYNVGAYPECLEDYELAYPLLKTNGSFLVQYGKAMEMAGKYDSSIVILKEAKQHLNNTVLHTCLGNNYKTLGKNTEAEQAYLHAWYMAPARFYPLYLLAKLYDETGQTEKAVAMAKKLLEKEVKIESTAIQEIQEEMRKIIEKGDAGTLNESHIQTDKNLTPIYKETKEEAYRSVVLTDKFMLQKW